MTERERQYRRREMERRMRARAKGRRNDREKKGGFTAFRMYVASVLVGGCLLVSVFQTETSEMVCAKVKETIAEQTPVGEMSEWKNKVIAYIDKMESAVPVFELNEPDTKKNYHPDTEP